MSGLLTNTWIRTLWPASTHQTHLFHYRALTFQFPPITRTERRHKMKKIPEVWSSTAGNSNILSIRVQQDEPAGSEKQNCNKENPNQIFKGKNLARRGIKVLQRAILIRRNVPAGKQEARHIASCLVFILSVKNDHDVLQIHFRIAFHFFD